MITTLILMTKAFLLGYLLAYFEPLQYTLSKLTSKIKSKNTYVNYIIQGISCHRCMATWICFFMTLNIYAAAGVALSVYLFELIMIKLR